MTADDRRLLSGLEAPQLPDDLRALTLARAQRALGARVTPVDVWRRLWASPVLRVSWLGTVAALVVANILLGVWSTGRPRPSGATLHSLNRTLEPELRAVAELPALRRAAHRGIDAADVTGPA